MNMRIAPSVIIFLYFMLFPVMSYSQTEYDVGQDKYIDALVSSLSLQINKLETQNLKIEDKNISLERENSSLGAKVELLMWVAFLAISSLLGLCVYIIKTTKAAKVIKIILVILILGGIFLFIKPEPGYCMSCISYQCVSLKQCVMVGCNYCETRRNVPYPFRCR